MTRIILITFVLISFLVVEALAQEVPSSRDPELVGPELAAAALERTSHRVTYDGAYQRIPYPGGDVTDTRGVCTDVVIRSYRSLGIDLQQLIHEDMVSDFVAYPKIWGLKRPDPNIDHRRVPNMRRFFERKGVEVRVTREPGDFMPGDLVAYNLAPGGNLPHIGIVSSATSAAGMPLVIHNIGAGPKLEDVLFAYKMTGHYRYPGPVSP